MIEAGMPITTSAERIRDALAEMYAAEPAPDELAEQLVATAAAIGVDEHVIVLWIHDRPRHEMSAAHFRRWCALYGFCSP